MIGVGGDREPPLRRHRRWGNGWGYRLGRASRQPDGAWRPLGGALVRRSAGCSLSLERN